MKKYPTSILVPKTFSELKKKNLLHREKIMHTHAPKKIHVLITISSTSHPPHKSNGPQGVNNLAQINTHKMIRKLRWSFSSNIYVIMNRAF